MNRFRLIAALFTCVVCCANSVCAYAAIVNTGDIVQLNFDLSADPGVILPPDRIDYFISFDSSNTQWLFNPGESFTVNWYESQGDLTPIEVENWNAPTFDVSLVSEVIFTSVGVSDAEGVLEITNIVGTLNIASIAMRTLKDGVFTDFVAQSYQVIPTPLPASVLLFSSGLLGLIGISRRKRSS